ncbi:MAG: hypothetical protein JXJ04_24410 [Spirochaetales bacterium]|nr:hypothetical protein [Spirochaetales bacterium]
MKLKKLHDPEDGELRIVGLMSGSGTNLRKVLEHETALRINLGRSPYRIVAIFSDNYLSAATELGKDFNLPVIIRDIKSFYNAHNLPRQDMTLREEYDKQTVAALAPYGASCAIYAGYMSITTPVFINAFLGINVHPADLSVTINGKRRWTGGHAVRDAIIAGEKTICSSTHLVEPLVDGGRILMISAPLTVEIPSHLSLTNSRDLREIEQLNQDRLKKTGDWVIMPKTIEYIARGRYGADGNGKLYFDGEPVPDGLRV